jgi:hypothetical protein
MLKVHAAQIVRRQLEGVVLTIITNDRRHHKQATIKWGLYRPKEFYYIIITTKLLNYLFTHKPNFELHT